MDKKPIIILGAILGVVLLVVVMVHVGTEIVVGGVLLQGVAVGAALAV